MATLEKTSIIPFITSQAVKPANNLGEKNNKQLHVIHKDGRPTQFKVFKLKDNLTTPDDSAFKRLVKAYLVTHSDNSKEGIPAEDIVNGLKSSYHGGDYDCETVTGQALLDDPGDGSGSVLNEVIEDAEGKLKLAYRYAEELDHREPTALGFLPSPLETLAARSGDLLAKKDQNKLEIIKGTKTRYVEAIVIAPPESPVSLEDLKSAEVIAAPAAVEKKDELITIAQGFLNKSR